MIGARIVQASWATVVILAIVGVLDLTIDDFDAVAVGVCVVLFFVSLPVWLYALGRAAARSTQGDDIAVASLFFLQGSAPAEVRRQLFAAFGACCLVAFVTAWANPFAVLVPTLPLGLLGLWGARYGTYPQRRTGR